MKTKTIVLLGILLFSTGTLLSSPAFQKEQENIRADLEEGIKNAVLSTVRYGIFDGVSFEVNGGEVVLSGFVVMPVTKIDIEHNVAKINGISKVTNEIEVLPLSRMDAAIRRQIYDRLFSTADMYRYAWNASPSIHIIVKGGRVSLEGVVSSEMDRTLAFLASRGVPGVFSLENNLVVAK